MYQISNFSNRVGAWPGQICLLKTGRSGEILLWYFIPHFSSESQVTTHITKCRVYF